MSNICPICGIDVYSARCAHNHRDFFAEIARLQAALEKAEREREETNELYITTQAYLNLMITQICGLEAKVLDAQGQRDEARMWAKYYQKLMRPECHDTTEVV